MVRKGWLEAHLQGSTVSLIAYPEMSGHFVRKVDLAALFPGMPVGHSFEPGDIALEPAIAALTLQPGRGDDADHLFLPAILWTGSRD